MSEARFRFRSQEDVVAAGLDVAATNEDVAAAARVFPRAEELGLGVELSLWRDPIWS
jgi:hypothetical protein